ncbi:UvrD-helicase domain-containing protein [Flavobacteriaceae bacterium M23B6Z8]
MLIIANILLNTPFSIYNASAGSGKTFTLVKKYLKILLSSKSPNQFKYILAITFTNKAVNEMKERVMAGLEDFTKEKKHRKNDKLFEIIAEELKLSDPELQFRAATVLKHILHNYAFFDIVTIDKFNHRLLRTFAYDLKLPLNFEVVIDTQLLLEEVIDELIFRAGSDKLLTKVLIDFALEKADNDKSWDISKDLYRIARLLLKEDYLEHVQGIQNKSLEDLRALGTQIRKQITVLEKEICSIATEVLKFLKNNDLSKEDFTRGSLPNFFEKIASGDFTVGFDTQWQKNIDSESLYPKKIKGSATAEIIDQLQPEIAEKHHLVHRKILLLRYRKNLLSNLTPLSLLSVINGVLKEIKEERNLLLISEFNQIISKEIGQQPAPFIYERIGEKYRHYFIDEFQDTSRMQWKNLIPLISNALESESLAGKTGSLMLVGDAKQAIYRWRGGVAEQFISLYDLPEHNPFQIPKHIFSLPKNYRSCEEIVHFNNTFFKHISAYLSEPHYQNLFKEHSHQESNHRKKGFVKLTFTDRSVNPDMAEAYCNLTYAAINEVLNDGKKLQDICILTRKKKEGVAIAAFLTEKKIPIISSESLLLKNDRRILFLTDLIRYTIQPKNKETIASLLLFISDLHQRGIHETMESYLENVEKAFHEFDFNMSDFQKLPLSEAVNYAIKSFAIERDSDGYLQYFLDEVLDYSLHHNSSFTDFISYWEKKEASISVVSPSNMNAVKIMTIHKSKGLEFPIVIYPFADSNISQDLDREIWLPVSKQDYGLTTALFTRNKDLAAFDDQTRQLCEIQEAKLELDQYNILYVALTRAVEQLYIYTLKDINSKGTENIGTYSGLFINYLKSIDLWSDDNDTYIFGEKPMLENMNPHFEQEIIPFAVKNPLKTSLKVITKGGSLWETTRETALEKGNLYHLLLSKIKYASDLKEIMEEALFAGTISPAARPDLQLTLSNVIHHPELQEYFSTAYTIYNEYDIYTKNGQIIRPDRLVISATNEAILMDYKTGSFSSSYLAQLEYYAKAVQEMGFEVQKKLLVFINDTIEIKSV